MAVNPGQELSSMNFGALIGGPLVAVIEAQTMAARSTADFIRTVGFDPDGNPVYVAFKYPKEVSPYEPAADAYIDVTNPGAGYQNAPTVSVPPSLNGITSITASVKDGSIESISFSGAPTSEPSSPIPITIPDPSTAPQPGDATAAAIYYPPKPYQPAVYVDMKIEVPILTILPIPFIRVEEATVDFNAKINAVETRSDSSDFAISGNLEVKQRWPSGSAKLNVSCSYQKKSASGSSVERTYSMQVHVRASQDEMPAGMEKLLSLLEGAMKSTPLVAA